MKVPGEDNIEEELDEREERKDDPVRKPLLMRHPSHITSPGRLNSRRTRATALAHHDGAR